jgi:hypothetical protein
MSTRLRYFGHQTTWYWQEYTTLLFDWNRLCTKGLHNTSRYNAQNQAAYPQA